MHTKITGTHEKALLAVLDSLAQELIDASDIELIAAADELGMDVTLQGSAAFAGVTYPASLRLSDFFDLD